MKTKILLAFGITEAKAEKSGLLFIVVRIISEISVNYTKNRGCKLYKLNGTKMSRSISLRERVEAYEDPPLLLPRIKIRRKQEHHGSAALRKEQREKQGLLTLSEVARKLGCSPQYLVLLVDRYQIVTPQREPMSRHRDRYVFTSTEVKQLQRAMHLKNLGITGSTTSEVLNPQLQAGFKNVFAHLFEFFVNPENAPHSCVIHALSELPIYSEEERKILQMVYGVGIEDTSRELKVTESYINKTLNEIRKKLGKAIFLYVISLDADLTPDHR